MLFLILAAVLSAPKFMTVQIELSSNKYEFRSGAAVLLTIPREGFELSRVEAERPEKVLRLMDNAIRNAEVPGAGLFGLILTDLTLVRLRDKREFHIPWFYCQNLRLSEDDLARGALRIEVNPEGVFKVVAVDPNQRPIPNKRLTFYGNMMLMSANFTTDSNGELMFLGNPTRYTMDLDGSFGVVVLPL